MALYGIHFPAPATAPTAPTAPIAPTAPTPSLPATLILAQEHRSRQPRAQDLRGFPIALGQRCFRAQAVELLPLRDASQKVKRSWGSGAGVVAAPHAICLSPGTRASELG